MKEITLNGTKFKTSANTMNELKEQALGDKSGEIYKFLCEFNANAPQSLRTTGRTTRAVRFTARLYWARG